MSGKITEGCLEDNKVHFPQKYSVLAYYSYYDRELFCTMFSPVLFSSLHHHHHYYMLIKTTEHKLSFLRVTFNVKYVCLSIQVYQVKKME